MSPQTCHRRLLGVHRQVVRRQHLHCKRNRYPLGRATAKPAFWRARESWTHLCEGRGRWLSSKCFLQSGLLVVRIEEGGHARGLFAEELAAKAEAAGAEMSPWACTLGKSYSCDQYLGPPTREFGAFSPSSNRLVAWAV